MNYSDDVNIRLLKIAELTEQFKDDPVKLMILNEMAKELNKMNFDFHGGIMFGSKVASTREIIEKLQKYEFHNLCIISLSITCMSTTRNQRIHFSPNNIKIFCAVLPIDIIFEVKSIITGDGNTIRNIK